jgi:hypothetical protein
MPWKRANFRMIIGLDIIVNKAKEASVEFVSDIRSDDELVVWSGTAIVGDNSIWVWLFSVGVPGAARALRPEG